MKGWSFKALLYASQTGLALGISFSLAVAMGSSRAMAVGRPPCSPPQVKESQLFLSDLPFGLTWQKTLELADAIYNSGKRLAMRAYWSPTKNSYVMPFSDNSKLLEIPISDHFIGSVTTHIEKSLERKYSQAILMSDMGHSHLLIPDEKFQTVYKDKTRAEIYHLVFDDPDVRILYHTAERMKFADDDPHMVWRKNTRNLVGENRPGGDVFVAPGYDDRAHTLREMEGYTWYSAGFNISASSQGCFPFAHQKQNLNFDLSLYDVQDIAFGPEYRGF